MHSSQSNAHFAPEPTESTHKSRRTPTLPSVRTRLGPNPELTPEASPRSVSPAAIPPRERRVFAPQLIETSRRSHRVGDSGPATRPTDKTDITPYTNHIYTTKSKSRKRHDGLIVEEEAAGRRKQPTRRETEEESVKEYLLELAAKEAERQIQEDALAAFPNSHAREGGVAHFYFREGSSSEESPVTSPAEDDRGRRRLRRKTSSLDLSWWQRQAQQHAEKLAHERKNDEEARRSDDMGMTSDSELDKMDLTVPPDAMWTTSRRASLGERRDSVDEQAEARKWAAATREKEALHVNRGPASGSGPDRSQLPAQPPAAANEFGIRNQYNPFGRPFAALGIRPNAAHLQRIRKFVSPPMLGKELTFRKCPSPKQTKLETDHSVVCGGAIAAGRNPLAATWCQPSCTHHT
ncbi:hypothetical protein NQ176_g7186 [Zarea fungicola]|uniref:Uncharacterized protein n=1 Tax=Zarea fungicola TaxID=93591 RepID=A0ACC1N0M7_9HYPO|nr:hypothetical protein NQ176_g7186 [Lecanicillium fungicola]